MLFKNLNNFTLEERVLYLQDKTKEIAEWITVHGAESKDIHAGIEEQIRQIQNELNAIQNNFSSQISLVRNESKSYTDSVATTKQSKLYLHTLTLDFNSTVTHGYVSSFKIKILDTESEPYSSLSNIHNKNILHSQISGSGPYYGLVLDYINNTTLYFHPVTYVGNEAEITSYMLFKVNVTSFNDTVTQL